MAAIPAFQIPDAEMGFALSPLGTRTFCVIGAQNANQALPALRVIFASAINSNTVRIYLTKEPRHVGPLGTTDALNRFNWTLQLITAGDSRVVEPEIEGMENVQFVGDFLVASGINEPFAFSVDMRTARRLATERSLFRVIASASIESADGQDTMAADPYDRGDFPGVVVVRPRRPERGRQTREDRLDYYYDSFLGVYILDSAKDLGTHSGAAALKKRIIRRVVSTPGGFTFLADYGAGVQVKELATTTQINNLRSNILRQVLSEEEVESASVDVTFENSVLYLEIVARTRRGAISTTLERDGNGSFTVVS